MISNPKVEMMPLEMKKALIWQRFAKTLCWAYEKSSFYHEKYVKANITPNDIRKLDDIKKIPLTSLEELKAVDPLELLTGPISTTMRLNTTISGLYRGYTSDDIARNIDISLRALASNDINKSSTVLICGKYSSQYLLDLHYAAEALGATVIPCNDPDSAIDITHIFNANTLIISSNNLLKFINIDIAFLPPKIIILLTAPRNKAVIDEIETKLGHTVPKIYMSSYFGLAGIAFTCEENHLHIQDDYLYPEIIDGKLVLTPLTFDAMPIIRLQTNIPVTLDHSICSCGRTFPAIKI